ncbi:hypothetical protein ANOM_005720 [Aspergillus nomiae NRRL 13137]|uniref:FAD-binding domain-containing protein n=1 Tax=Aspergillus nomiae NRRL (strain ATCC 15546 / NRRL 13137 / CBS 260.88 / M93) TaxID=1509407 RepID=A0A0L1J237_ASPN3|nr:uncharacterized protein ANOM_005720 [Aspergillus nomiae NRRL 13137]KNG85740.1 hypothetical protein ANOM_005720 [Aspergillus nomiae NRRL 13137]
MAESAEARPLRVLIAGAGIGGLFAAISLRHAGHHVEIFESSRFATELGAAIHLPPNVHGLLRRFGINPEEFNCNDAQFVTVYDSGGNVVSSKDVRNLRSVYPFSWKLSHRIDLHEALKHAAVSPDGPGRPAVIYLRSRVVSCDCLAPSLTLDNGKNITGDLIIGADGVHSALRQFVAQEDIAPTPSGGSAFRFLIPVSKVEENPETRQLLARPGEMQLWDGIYRRLVIYPCRNNTELNFVCLHPDGESEGSTEGWNNAASLEQVLKVYDEFCPAMKALLRMVNPEDIKLWRLLDDKALGTWISGKSCLIGDAAHPFLPHQGQGGAQAIEDGAALGALFPLGTKPAEVAARLQLYMKCRYDRATMVQEYSRLAAFKTSPDDKVGGTSTDPLEFSRINFGHDAYDFAENVLLKTRESAAAHQGPLTRVFGPSSLAKPPSTMSGQSSLVVSFRTRRNYLETFLPTYDCSIRAMGGWATVSLAFTRHGEQHARLVLSIPDAMIDPGNQEIETFTPVIFDNDIDSVMFGTEQGLPLCYADIREYTLGDNRLLTVGRGEDIFIGISVVMTAKNDTQVFFSQFTEAEMSSKYPALAHVIGRIQKLEVVEVIEVVGAAETSVQ